MTNIRVMKDTIKNQLKLRLKKGPKKFISGKVDSTGFQNSYTQRHFFTSYMSKKINPIFLTILLFVSFTGE